MRREVLYRLPGVFFGIARQLPLGLLVHPVLGLGLALVMQHGLWSAIAEWGLALAGHAGYAVLWIAVSFTVSLLLLRRKSLA